MSPFVPILLLIGGAAAFSLFKTVKAAKNLDFKVLKFSIYNLVKNGNIVFRLNVRITNAKNTPLNVQLIDIGGYLDPKTTTQNGKTVLSSKGTLIATLTENTPFTIQKNGYTDKEFFVSASWAKIGETIGTTVLQNLLSNLLNSKFLISGKVKAEGFVVPIQQIVNINR